MLSINLNNLLFHSYHGVHDEEKVVGGKFEVSVNVTYTPARLPIDSLDNTINYVSVYELVKQRMALPTPLLENIVTELSAEILNKFDLAETVTISISKLSPPIVGFRGNVSVSFTQKREQ